MVSMSHLYEYRGKYYFRMRVPQDLLAFYPGPHIKKSLKTANLMMAARIARALSENLETAFQVLRNSPLPQGAAERLISEQINFDCDTFRRVGAWNRQDDSQKISIILDDEADVKYHQDRLNITPALGELELGEQIKGAVSGIVTFEEFLINAWDSIEKVWDSYDQDYIKEVMTKILEEIRSGYYFNHIALELTPKIINSMVYRSDSRNTSTLEEISDHLNRWIYVPGRPNFEPNAAARQKSLSKLSPRVKSLVESGLLEEDAIIDYAGFIGNILYELLGHEAQELTKGIWIYSYLNHIFRAIKEGHSPDALDWQDIKNTLHQILTDWLIDFPTQLKPLFDGYCTGIRKLELISTERFFSSPVMGALTKSLDDSISVLTSKDLRKKLEVSYSKNSITNPYQLMADVDAAIKALLEKHGLDPDQVGVKLEFGLAMENSEGDRKGKLISELLDKYIDFKMTSDSWNEKSRKTIEPLLRFANDVLGQNMGIREIKMDDYVSLLKTLKETPRNIGKTKSKYGDKTIQEIIESGSDDEKLDKTTIAKYIDKFKCFLNWCVKHEYIEKNPWKGEGLKDSKSSTNAKKPYSKDELTKLLNSAIFNPEEKGYKRILKKHPEAYYVVLLGLYTGMRMNEICSLTAENIKEEKGIHYIDVCQQSGGESLKSSSALRRVPLHDDIIKIGFIQFVEESRKKGHARLWPHLKMTINGYADQFQKFFGAFNRKHITQEKSVTFHSLRHNFTDALKQAGGKDGSVATDVIVELLGHQHLQSMTMDRYGEKYSLAILQGAIQKLDFGVDVVGIVMSGKTKKDEAESQ